MHLRPKGRSLPQTVCGTKVFPAANRHCPVPAGRRGSMNSNELVLWRKQTTTGPYVWRRTIPRPLESMSDGTFCLHLKHYNRRLDEGATCCGLVSDNDPEHGQRTIYSRADIVARRKPFEPCALIPNFLLEVFWFRSFCPPVSKEGERVKLSCARLTRRYFANAPSAKN